MSFRAGLSFSDSGEKELVLQLFQCCCDPFDLQTNAAPRCFASFLSKTSFSCLAEILNHRQRERTCPGTGLDRFFSSAFSASLFLHLILVSTTGLPVSDRTSSFFLDPVVRVIDPTAPTLACRHIFCQKHGILFRGSLIRHCFHDSSSWRPALLLAYYLDRALERICDFLAATCLRHSGQVARHTLIVSAAVIYSTLSPSYLRQKSNWYIILKIS